MNAIQLQKLIATTPATSITIEGGYMDKSQSMYENYRGTWESTSTPWYIPRWIALRGVDILREAGMTIPEPTASLDWMVENVPTILRQVAQDLEVADQLPDKLQCELDWAQWLRATEELKFQVTGLVTNLQDGGYEWQSGNTTLKAIRQVSGQYGIASWVPEDYITWPRHQVYDPSQQTFVAEAIQEARAWIDEQDRERKAVADEANRVRKLLNEVLCPKCHNHLQHGQCHCMVGETGSGQYSTDECQLLTQIRMKGQKTKVAEIWIAGWWERSDLEPGTIFILITPDEWEGIKENPLKVPQRHWRGYSPYTCAYKG